MATKKDVKEEVVEEVAVKPVKKATKKTAEEKAAEETALLLEKESPLALINEHIVPALDIVGKEYESGKKFLPQLLLNFLKKFLYYFRLFL